MFDQKKENQKSYPLTRFVGLTGYWTAAAALTCALMSPIQMMAATPSQSILSPPNPAVPSSTTTSETPQKSKLQNIGINYFVFLDGPGLDPSLRGTTPNGIGLPNEDGISSFNLISLRWKFRQNLALDLQTRTEIVYNNAYDRKQFSAFRWESPRIGISGKLLSGKDWTLTGAVNTDFPYSFPSPLGGGFTTVNRTTLFNPGTFANFSYTPSASRWSVFSIVAPRYFIYGDPDAAEPQFSAAGMRGNMKPEFVLALLPSINYRISPIAQIRTGTSIDFRKLVASGWNPLQATHVLNDPNDTAWRLQPMPLQVGVNFEIAKWLSVFPYVSAIPISGQRVNASPGRINSSGTFVPNPNFGRQATLLESAMVGMWISGTIL